ncbi:MAG: ABC transporter ATP-binding protein [Clostridia bacterium]
MIIAQAVNLGKKYGENEIFRSVSITFESGKIYGFIGRNGSGKSVFMKCMAGLVCPTSGYVEVLGKQIGRDTDFAEETGIAIEQPGLLLRKSAFENLRIMTSLSRRPSSPEIISLLKLVGLDPREKKIMSKYSMGMKQRLGIALALLGSPKLLLLDEPMSNLDQTSAEEMRVLFRELAKQGKTVIVATHIKDDIADLCDHVCLFENKTVAILGNRTMG